MHAVIEHSIYTAQKNIVFMNNLNRSVTHGLILSGIALIIILPAGNNNDWLSADPAYRPHISETWKRFLFCHGGSSQILNIHYPYETALHSKKFHIKFIICTICAKYFWTFHYILNFLSNSGILCNVLHTWWTAKRPNTLVTDRGFESGKCCHDDEWRYRSYHVVCRQFKSCQETAYGFRFGM